MNWFSILSFNNIVMFIIGYLVGLLTPVFMKFKKFVEQEDEKKEV